MVKQVNNTKSDNSNTANGDAYIDPNAPKVMAYAKKNYFVNVQKETPIQKLKYWFLRKRYESETRPHAAPKKRPQKAPATPKHVTAEELRSQTKSRRPLPPQPKLPVSAPSPTLVQPLPVAPTPPPAPNPIPKPAPKPTPPPAPALPVTPKPKPASRITPKVRKPKIPRPKTSRSQAQRKSHLPLIISISAFAVIGIIILVAIILGQSSKPTSEVTTENPSSYTRPSDNDEDFVAWNKESEDIYKTLKGYFDNPSEGDPEQRAIAYLNQLNEEATKYDDYTRLYRLANLASTFWLTQRLYQHAIDSLLSLDPSHYDEESRYAIYYSLFSIYDYIGDTENADKYLALANEIRPTYRPVNNHSHNHSDSGEAAEGTSEEPAANTTNEQGTEG